MTQQMTLEERYGLKISCTAVQSIFRTGGMMLEPLYSDIPNKIVTEKILGLDETTFPIGGRTGWMSGCKKQNRGTIHIIERCQDSKKVLEKILGILVSDGYAPTELYFVRSQSRDALHIYKEMPNSWQ